jgi:hypothetical protein
VAVDITKAADTTIISKPTPVASTHDVDTQSRTEIATEQKFIRRSKRVIMKRPVEAGNNEALAASSKRAKR